jgi:uncharacterized membrane protein (DUF106 family)
MQDILANFLQSIAALLAPVGSMPLSTPFVAIVSILVALLTTWATKRFSDVEQANADMEEIKAWQTRFNEARNTMNQELLEEVMADQGRIMKLQGNMMSSKMKPMCITWIPILAVFGVLSTLFGATPVAILPQFHWVVHANEHESWYDVEEIPWSWDNVGSNSHIEVLHTYH